MHTQESGPRDQGQVRVHKRVSRPEGSSASYRGKRLDEGLGLRVDRIPRIRALVDAYIANGCTSVYQAAREAGFMGSSRGATARALRILKKPQVVAYMRHELDRIARSRRIASPAEVLSLLSETARDPNASRSWWETGAKSKALELLAKHYGLMTESVTFRDMPATMEGVTKLLIQDMRRVGMLEDYTRSVQLLDVKCPGDIAEPQQLSLAFDDKP